MRPFLVNAAPGSIQVRAGQQEARFIANRYFHALTAKSFDLMRLDLDVVM